MADNEQHVKNSHGPGTPLPVLLNPGAGSAGQVEQLLAGDHRFQLRKLRPRDMGRVIEQAVAEKTPRLAVCGGDGTLNLAASLIAGSDTELAVIPGGTLNHFARREGIPEPREALELALSGEVRRIAAGTVNGRLFLNTSSLGLYVNFVRSRDRLQRRMGYYPATVVAGLRRLARLRSPRFRLGEEELRTPLIFVGLGERELRFPFMGDAKPDGRSGLHLIAVHHQHWLDAAKLALAVLAQGIEPLHRRNAVRSRMIHRLTVAPHRARRRLPVALDGEIKILAPPLHYSFVESALALVCPW